MKLRYNSPVILSFTLLAALSMALELLIGESYTSFFQTPPFWDPANIRFYTGIFLHPLAHAGWDHLLGNFAIILLVGPILEEKYGSKDVLFMIAVTALFTGLLNMLLFDHTVIGASGVVFMLILLSSFSNSKAGTLPLTFLLVLALYLGREVYEGLAKQDNISHFSHIIGGLAGAIFGFLIEKGAQSKTIT